MLRNPFPTYAAIAILAFGVPLCAAQILAAAPAEARAPERSTPLATQEADRPAAPVSRSGRPVRVIPLYNVTGGSSCQPGQAGCAAQR